MPAIHFSHPELLFTALIPVLLFVWLLRRAAHRAGRVALSSYDCLPIRKYEPVALLWLSRVFRLLAMLCAVLLLAGISHRTVVRQAADESAAMIIALDVSSSMTAGDFAPQDRLEAAKQLLHELVVAHPAAEIGLVQFAAFPRLLTPLTTDRGAVAVSLEGIRPAAYDDDGTAIGSALASALNRLRGSRAGRRTVLLITDGVNNSGSMAPLDAARIAKSLGISVYGIGLGTDSVSRFRVPAPQGGAIPMEARIEIDDKALELVTGETGGRYWRVRNTEELRAALQDLPIASMNESPAWTEAVDPLPTWGLALCIILCLFLECLTAHLLYSELPG